MVVMRMGDEHGSEPVHGVEAEKFIEGVEDAEMRTILRMYYINNSSQKEIGEMMHYSQTAISTKLSTFWFSQGDKDKTRSKRRK